MMIRIQMAGRTAATLVFAGAMLLPMLDADAAVLTYDRDGNSANGITDASGGTWNAGNALWFSDIATPDVAWPNTAADTAVFGSGSGSVYTVNTSGTLTLNGITFNNASGTNYTLNAGGTLSFAGATPTITVNTAANINTAMTATSLIKTGAAALTINNSANNLGALTLNQGFFDIFSALTTTDVVVNGSATVGTHSSTTWSMDSLTHNSTGTSLLQSLSSASVYTIGAGGLSISAGTVRVSTDSSTSMLTLNGLLSMSGGSLTILTSTGAGAAKVILNGNIDVTGTSTISSSGAGTESLDLNGSVRTITVNDSTKTLSLNALVQNGGITKEGAGTVSLGGSDSNLYTGMTTVNAGKLILNKGSGATAITGDVTVNGGILAWNTAENLNDTSSIFLNGGSLQFNAKTETFKDLIITGGNVNDGGGSNGGFVNITGTLSGSGSTGSGVNLNSGGQWTVEKVTFASSFNPSGSEISLNGNNSRLTLFTVGAGGLTLAGQTISLEKSPTGSGNLGSELALNGNVTASGTNLISFNGANADGASQVNLGSGTRTFDITSGTTTSNSAFVSLNDGSGAVTPARTTVTGGLTKTGAGSLVLNAVNTYTGATTINAGTVKLGSAGTIDNSASLHISGAAFLDVTSKASYAYTHDVSGAGTVLGSLSLTNDTLSPGDNLGADVGTMNITGNLLFGVGTAAVFQLQTPDTTVANAAAIATLTDPSLMGTHDFLNVTGTINFPVALMLDLTGYSASIGDVFDLADFASSTGPLPAISVIAGSLGGFTFDTSRFADLGVLVVIPEPSKMVLLCLGGLLLSCRRKR